MRVPRLRARHAQSRPSVLSGWHGHTGPARNLGPLGIAKAVADMVNPIQVEAREAFGIEADGHSMVVDEDVFRLATGSGKT